MGKKKGAKSGKLCKFVKDKGLKDGLKTYKTLVRRPTHVCTKCGRAAMEEGYLCHPEPL